MQLVSRTWIEVDEYLKNSDGLIIPIGSCEQHGPIGMMGTDALCAEAIAIGVGEKTDVLVTPTINVGMSAHHGAFPGSMTLRPSTLINVIRDHVLCMVDQGFRHFFIVNGHGGNGSSISAAEWEISAELKKTNRVDPSQVYYKAAQWWHPKAVKEVTHKHFGDKEGGHATPGELSIAMYAYPDLYKERQMPDSLPPYDRNDFTASVAKLRDKCPDGRIGSDSWLANVEAGRELYETAVDVLSESYAKFVAEATN